MNQLYNPPLVTSKDLWDGEGKKGKITVDIMKERFLMICRASAGECGRKSANPSFISTLALAQAPLIVSD